MENEWTHIGRLWTNGEPYLVLDADLRQHWLGFSQDEYSDRIVALTPDEIAVTVGDRAAVVVGADGEVRDDSWMEVFESADGAVAVVQASGPDYRQVLAAALDHAGDPTDPEVLIECPSGELAVLSAAGDGTGRHAMKLVPARPGPVPAEHGPASRSEGTGLLLVSAAPRYRVRATWYTELDGVGYFARWLLTPQPSGA